ncbi:MAG TPA: AAA family ATPase, partial [Acidimicrobiia bacterium]
MRLVWVELRDFRSYHECLLRPDAGTNLLIGPNGAGKTNFLEAVSYLGWLRSFRRVPEQSMVLEGADSAVVRTEVTSGDIHTVLGVEVPIKGRRRVALNGKPLRTSGVLSDHIRVVVFFPDDLDIVKRGPGGRREFLDDCGAELWPGARADLQDYERALRQRNALLKRLGRDFDLPTLQVWDEKLSQAAGRVMSRRARTMRMLDRYLSEMYAVLAG